MKRRTFLHRAGLGSLIAAYPSIIAPRISRAASPSDRITVGFIGLGNQSTIDLPTFLGNDDVQVVAVCDVNQGSRGYKQPEQFLGREPGRQQVDAHYAQQTKSGTYRGCRAYSDFRELLASDDIDAVVIIVPDHWHAIMTIMAARAGKDIYCEKPLSLTLDEGKLMRNAVRRYGRILQTGSQHRSGPAARLACELVLNGHIGKLERIETFVPENNAEEPGRGWQAAPVPEGFDYDMWLGPAPDAPYHPGRCLYRFRFLLDYSGGQVTNFGTHMLDIAQWGHGSDHTGPVRFDDLDSEWPEAGCLYNTATKVGFRAVYEDGVSLTCQTKPKTSLCRFVGSDGWIQYQSGKLEHSDNVHPVLSPNDRRLPVSNEGRSENNYKYYLADHVRNFLDAVKTRRDPISPVECGHRTASLCHLGNLAMRLKRTIHWDPATEQVLGDSQAASLLSREPREPWSYGVT
jgi:predicted dehydrogenase